MKRFILCAGFGYEFSREPFRKFCETRQKLILDGNAPGEDVSIQLFDVASGTVTTTEQIWRGGKPSRAPPKKEQKFEPVTRKMYDRPPPGEKEWQFKDSQRGIMSITDIYDAIISIGRGDPNSLVEVSIFSHAVYMGPILVNSRDDGFVAPVPGANPNQRIPLDDGARDPDDYDGRGSKDFIAPNMVPKKLQAFRSAFTPKGYVWIWGCNFPKVINKVLRLVERNPRYSAAITDDAVLSFNGLKADEIESFLVLNNFFELDRGKLLRTRKCEVSFGMVKDALWAGTAGCYAYKVATVARIRALGALYGTFADFYAGTPELMAINIDTLPHVSFYKRHFNFRTDSENRNYGIFEPEVLAPK